jgi:CBS domain-containing protein
MLRVRDIMTTDTVTVPPELTIREAMAVLATRHVSGAPVVASGKVLGVVSASDLIDFAASLPGVPTDRTDEEEAEPTDSSERGDAATTEEEPPQAFFSEMWEDAGADVVARMNAVDSPEWDVLEEHTVDEAMTRNVFAVSSETSVELAADKMRAAGVHRALVIDEDALVGIVTTKDIADAVADHRLTTNSSAVSAKKQRDQRLER